MSHRVAIRTLGMAEKPPMWAPLAPDSDDCHVDPVVGPEDVRD